MACHALLQGTFPTQGLKPGLPHWQVGSLPAELSGKPQCANIFKWKWQSLSRVRLCDPTDYTVRALKWVAFSFHRGSSQPRVQPGSPGLQVDSLPTELSGKPANILKQLSNVYFFFTVQCFTQHKINHFKVNNSVAFSAFARPYTHPLYLLPFILWKETWTHGEFTPQAPRPPASTIWILFLWIYLSEYFI